MLDRATRELMEQMAAAGGKPLAECTPEEARAYDAEWISMAGPGPAMGRVEELQAPGPNGPIPIRLLVPQQKVRALVVYLHGGGWVLGTLDSYDSLCRKLAERTSAAVAMVDYRLAPEHRYPAAIDDSYAAVEWLASRCDSIAGSGAPFIVAGDSAGGNLTAVVAQRARDRNGPKIALQILIYPVTDADLDRPGYLDPEQQALLLRDEMVWFWDHYVPDSTRRAEPDASPIRAADLGGLPPAVVLTAEHDVLRDEGEEYAARLAAAGVPVEMKRYAGQAHGFFSILSLPGGELGLQQVVMVIRRCIAKPDRPVVRPRTAVASPA